jgi:hypothetical protein
MIPKTQQVFRVLAILSIIIVLFVFILYLVRFFSHTEIDDISPDIPCSMDLLDKSDYLLIIPKFNNHSIAENKTWCNFILSLNKTLYLHGVTHIYEEFKTERSGDYLQEGIDIFKECFGFYPKEFKPPQLAISNNNKKLIRSNMKLYGKFNQLTHKVYHCNDSSTPNWFIDLV